LEVRDATTDLDYGANSHVPVRPYYPRKYINLFICNNENSSHA